MTVLYFWLSPQHVHLQDRHGSPRQEEFCFTHTHIHTHMCACTHIHTGAQKHQTYTQTHTREYWSMFMPKRPLEMIKERDRRSIFWMKQQYFTWEFPQTSVNCSFVPVPATLKTPPNMGVAAWCHLVPGKKNIGREYLSTPLARSYKRVQRPLQVGDEISKRRSCWFLFMGEGRMDSEIDRG